MASVLKILCWLSALGFTGCLIIPVPTIPLNLPAHGHTYRIHDQGNRTVADDGLLIISTEYEGMTDTIFSSRIDCYPIRDGKAKVPIAFDIRQWGLLEFLSDASHVPVFIIGWANADYAYVYPLVPGHIHGEGYREFAEEHYIYGVKPRPDVLRVSPCARYDEEELLEDIGSSMSGYVEIAEETRRRGYRLSREDLYNEKQARRILDFVRKRQKSLAEKQKQPAMREQKQSIESPRTQPAEK